jgi:hypothetical protein
MTILQITLKPAIVSTLLATLLMGGSALGQDASPLPHPTPTDEYVTSGGPDYHYPFVTLGPTMYGLRLSLTGVRKTRVGQTAVVDLWLNTTGGDVQACFGSFRQSLRFDVTDSRGTALPPSAKLPLSASRIQTHCGVRHNVQERFTLDLNDYVPLTQAGTYTIKADLAVVGGHPPQPGWIHLQSNSITMRVLR